jgi:mannose-1-phosphate guanylyltransferase
VAFLVYAVILAGGRGERFWPLSRSRKAKQFLPIAGERTLLAETSSRVGPLVPESRQLVVSGKDQVDLVRQSLPTLPPGQILAERFGKNTAPAVALGAAWVLSRDADATLVVIPSDAWVGDVAAYRESLERAVTAALASDALVTLGVTPTRPETGYGYLEVGDELPGQAGVFEVRRFVEKPDPALALAYVTGGRHLWNCGIFVMKARVVLDAIRRFLPDVAEPLDRLDFSRAVAQGEVDAFYDAVPSVSIDYGVMEKADNVLTVRSTFAWDDLGSWAALERVRPAGDGALSHGDALLLDSPGAIVYSESGLVAVLGVPDLIVVRTADATLVLPRERAQEVRRIVQTLAERDDLKRYT